MRIWRFYIRCYKAELFAFPLSGITQKYCWNSMNLFLFLHVCCKFQKDLMVIESLKPSQILLNVSYSAFPLKMILAQNLFCDSKLDTFEIWDLCQVYQIKPFRTSRYFCSEKIAPWKRVIRKIPTRKDPSWRIQR